MIGKFCATAAFSTVYVVTSEIFPTVIRNAAMGGGSMCARVGGMVAPYIAGLVRFFITVFKVYRNTAGHTTFLKRH